MLVAGEASGDLHGAALCLALSAERPGCRLLGMGGARMAAAGMERLVDVTAAAVAGGSEAVSRIPLLYRAYRRLAGVLRAPGRPSVLVLIDFPEFNLRLARVARGVGIPVVYFIPPQIWVWRGRRVTTIRRLVSRVLAVFPFEAPIYQRAGVPVDFVGHPLLDTLAGAPDQATARRRLGLDPRALVLGLLPGSRREEIARVLPAMREAITAVAARHREARFTLALAPTVEPAAVEEGLAGAPPVTIARAETHAVIRAADLVLVASGTATLEAALLGTPMIVCYRVSCLTELMVRLLMRVPWISLPNLTLGRSVVPELYQGAASGRRLGHEALRLLAAPEELEAQRAAFRELARQLGEPGVAARSARLVLAEAGAAR